MGEQGESIWLFECYIEKCKIQNKNRGVFGISRKNNYLIHWI